MLLFQEELARAFWNSSDCVRQSILDFISQQNATEFMKLCNCITNYPFRR